MAELVFGLQDRVRSMERHQPTNPRQLDTQGAERGRTSDKLLAAHQRIGELNENLNRASETIAKLPDLHRTALGTDLLVQRLISEDRGHQPAATHSAQTHGDGHRDLTAEIER